MRADERENHLRGLCERAESPENRLGPGVTVPESVPVTVEFGTDVVGTAALSRRDDGIWAEATVQGSVRLYQVPHFAVGVMNAEVTTGGVVTAGQVNRVCLVRENVDPDLPQYEVACLCCGENWLPPATGPFCDRCDDDLEHLDALFYGDISICGCGNPEDAYALVRDVLQVMRDKDEKPADDGDRWWERVRELIGSGGAHQIVLSVMTNAGLIEHGGCIPGWLTLKGKHYLGLMERYDWEDVDQTGMPHYGRDGSGDGVCGPGCRHWEASTEEYEKDRLKREAASGRR